MFFGPVGARGVIFLINGTLSLRQDSRFAEIMETQDAKQAVHSDPGEFRRVRSRDTATDLRKLLQSRPLLILSLGRETGPRGGSEFWPRCKGELEGRVEELALCSCMEVPAGTFKAQGVVNTPWAYATMGREPGAGVV